MNPQCYPWLFYCEFTSVFVKKCETGDNQLMESNSYSFKMRLFRFVCALSILRLFLLNSMIQVCQWNRFDSHHILRRGLVHYLNNNNQGWCQVEATTNKISTAIRHSWSSMNRFCFIALIRILKIRYLEAARSDESCRYITRLILATNSQNVLPKMSQLVQNLLQAL